MRVVTPSLNMEAKTKRMRARRMVKVFKKLLQKEKVDIHRKVILLVIIVIRKVIPIYMLEKV